jgi:hypothetical protein
MIVLPLNETYYEGRLVKYIRKFTKHIEPINKLIDRKKTLLRKFLSADDKIQNLNSAHELLVKDYNQAKQELSSLQNQIDFLQKYVDYVKHARAEGRIVEFDYGYHPQVRDWNNLPKGNLYQSLISSRDEDYRQWVAKLAKYGTYFQKITRAGSPEGVKPFWDNGWFPPLDGICLYGLIAETKPRLYIEVGSGNSTKFVRRAISDHGLETRIISIDPYPRAVIDEVIRTPFEKVDLSRFEELQSGDMMFVDNSHRSFQSSDVTVFFTEVLPGLAKGVLWGVHDIFLPLDYPEGWLGRMYNEQYLLMAYLLGGAGGDRIELPVAYLAKNPRILADLHACVDSPPWEDVPLVGGAFWMRKA